MDDSTHHRSSDNNTTEPTVQIKPKLPKPVCEEWRIARAAFLVKDNEQKHLWQIKRKSNPDLHAYTGWIFLGFAAALIHAAEW